MSKTAKIRIILFVLTLLIIAVIVFFPLPMLLPLKYFLIFIVTVLSYGGVFPKYIKELKQTHHIASKKNLIVDILCFLIWFHAFTNILI